MMQSRSKIPTIVCCFDVDRHVTTVEVVRVSGADNERQERLTRCWKCPSPPSREQTRWPCPPFEREHCGEE